MSKSDLSKYDIKSIIESLGLEGLEINGDLYNFRCPICGDSKKDKNKKRGYFYWRTDKNTYYYKCHNCGAHHSFLHYIKTYEPDIFKQILFEKYKNRQIYNTKRNSNNKTLDIKINNSEVKNIIHKLFNEKKIVSIKESENPNVYKYVYDRKIPKAKYKQLYYTSNFYKYLYTPLKKMLGVRVKENVNNKNNDPRIFWFIKDYTNNIIGIQGRSITNSNLRYLTVKIVDNIPMIGNLENIDVNKNIYVTEGFIDSLFLDNAISLNGSSYISTIKMLKKIKAKNAIIIFDNEPYNSEIREKVKNLIDLVINKKYTNIKICLLPKNIRSYGKDINDYVKSGMSIKKIINIIDRHSYNALMAKIKFTKW